ncbi:MAG: PRC-barrel domain-containing protein [Bacteriovorax sp.]|nr:PRC-barrel domain-containing protein [Bacteriovorax sp.]
MLKNLKKITNFKILAKDCSDAFGRVKDIYFDDEKWGVRYLVVDTGRWLSESLTLVSPYNVIEVDWDEGIVWVNLTKRQIENGPKAELNKPVTRLYESQYNNYYGLPHYWASGLGLEIDGLWAGSFYPRRPESLGNYNASIDYESQKEQHLRSMLEIFGYHIQAVGDDDFGSVTDFILEESTWAIRYIVIDTHKFWPGGKKILFSPSWVEKFDWNSKKLVTKFHRKVIESCPEYNPEIPIENIIEESLFSHFGKSGHWNLKGWDSKGIDYSSHHLK